MGIRIFVLPQHLLSNLWQSDNIHFQEFLIRIYKSNLTQKLK